MHPHADKVSILETIRITGVFLYLLDLCVKIGYFTQSKYASVQIRDQFKMFLIARPMLILAYHLVLQGLAAQRLYLDYHEHSQYTDI